MDEDSGFTVSWSFIVTVAPEKIANAIHPPEREEPDDPKPGADIHREYSND
jgi:hypothetical protein